MSFILSFRNNLREKHPGFPNTNTTSSAGNKLSFLRPSYLPAPRWKVPELCSFLLWQEANLLSFFSLTPTFTLTSPHHNNNLQTCSCAKPLSRTGVYERQRVLWHETEQYLCRQSGWQRYLEREKKKVMAPSQLSYFSHCVKKSFFKRWETKINYFISKEIQVFIY